MSELYPLLLLPEFHERVWGSRDLSLIYPHKTARQGGEFDQPIGEAWLTGDQCRVANGPLAGQTLADVTKKSGCELLGEACTDHSRFPLLLKFLFPRAKLSVQVHPDDIGAKAIGQPCGKTECWYVMAAEPGAQVALGLKPGVTRTQVETAINDVQLEPLMNWLDVNPGELIYVDAGTVHAIGPGSILLETQQNSDTTYRLYDYGRGRELHIQQGLAATKEKTHAGKVKRIDASNGTQTLVASPCFVIEKTVIREPKEFVQGKSVQALVALDGCGVIETDGAKPVTLAKGECVIVPAQVGKFLVRPQWAVELYCAKLPEGKIAHPVTSMS